MTLSFLLWNRRVADPEHFVALNPDLYKNNSGFGAEYTS